jgi:hypothetical protein
MIRVLLERQLAEGMEEEYRKAMVSRDISKVKAYEIPKTLTITWSSAPGARCRTGTAGRALPLGKRS